MTNIDFRFLANCSRITAIDLAPLRSITSVGDFFLAGCEALTSVDLTVLRNVRSIGQGFLLNCFVLTHVDLSSLRNVTRIGDAFLGCCDGLTRLASSPLAKQIGWNGDIRDELARLLVRSNKQRIAQRIADLHGSWNARSTALLIRNFAPRDHANDAFKIWSVMRCVVLFLSPLRVPDVVLMAEEKRMLQVTER